MSIDEKLAEARRVQAQSVEEYDTLVGLIKEAHSQLSYDGDGVQTLVVTVKDVAGPIAVDRVRVQPAEGGEPQEKVIASAIPCPFTLNSDVKSFQLVFLADCPATPEVVSPLATGGVAPVVLSGEGVSEVSSSGIEVSRPVEAGISGGLPIKVDTLAGPVLTATPSVPEAVEDLSEVSVGEGNRNLENGEVEVSTAQDPDVTAAENGQAIGAVVTGDKSVAMAKAVSNETDTAVGSLSVLSEAEASVKNGIKEGIVAVEATAAAAEEVAAAMTTGTPEAASGVEGTKVPVIETTEMSVEGATDSVIKSEAASIDGSMTEEVKGEALVDTSAAVTAAVEGKANTGASTVTKELVVESSSLNLKSTDGQWAYFEGEGEERKGVRFSTTLERMNSREASIKANERMMEITKNFDEASARRNQADAEVRRLMELSEGGNAESQDRAAQGRKKSLNAGSNGSNGSNSAGSTGPKGILKKVVHTGAAPGKKRGVKSGQRVVKGNAVSTVAGVVISPFQRVYRKAKPVFLLGYRMRNLAYFAAAVAVIHIKGDTFSV